MQAIDDTVIGGTTPLSLAELQTLINVVHSVDNRMPIPSDHHVYTRLLLTLTGGMDNNGEIAHALKLIAMLSNDPANREGCLAVISEAGGPLEGYLAIHSKMNSRVDGPDDEINRDMLTALIRITDYKLSGQEALETYSGNATQCMVALCSILRHIIASKPHIRDTMQQRPQFWQDDADFFLCVTRLLYEMTSYETYFYCVCGEGSDTDRPMAELARLYQEYVGNISNFCSKTPLIDLVAVVLDQWFEHVESNSSMDSVHLIPFFEAALSNVLFMVSNLLNVTTKFSAQFKSHLAKDTVLIQNVALPCLLFELDVLERGNFQPENVTRHMKLLMLVVKVVSLVSNKIKMFRPWLRKFPFLGSRMIKNPVLIQSDSKLEYAALVIRLIINAELNDSVAAIVDFHNTLTDAEKHRLALRLSNPREKMYPINIFCETYNLLRDVFAQQKAMIDAGITQPEKKTNPFLSNAKFAFPKVVHHDEAYYEQQEAAERARAHRKGRGGGSRKRNIQRFINYRRSKRRQVQRRYKIITKNNGGGGVNEQAPTHLIEEVASATDSDDEDENAGGTITQVQALEPVQVQVREMPSAVRLQEALQGTAQQIVQEALTVAVASIQEPQAQPAVEEEKVTVPIKSLPPLNAAPAVTHISGGVEQVISSPAKTPAGPTEDEDDEKEVEVDEGVAGSPFDLSPWRKRPPYGVPNQYLCALSQQFIRVPVISPNGDVFDKATIMEFLKVHPRQDPFTGEELYPNDLVVDSKFARELDAVRLNYAL